MFPFKQNNSALKYIITVVFVFFLCDPSNGQLPPRDIFNFIFENNFNDDQVGNYTNYDYVNDWKLPRASILDDDVDIINEGIPGYEKFMRGYFPQGTYLPGNHGFLWRSYFLEPLTEVYFSYDFRFKPGFEWVLGGKIPGLSGGDVIEGPYPPVTAGFSTRLMWSEGGKLVFYVYHQDQNSIYGNSYTFPNFTITSGKWYNVTIRVVLNTITDGYAANNGILEGFIDGKLIFQKKDFKFRSLETIKIDNMYISSFFGGSTDIWAAARDEWLDTDNYIAYTYSNKISTVPRGNNGSSWSEKLIHPYMSVEDSEWKNSLKVSGRETDEISLTWANFPVPISYTLERKIEGSTSFSTVASLPYGTTAYTDKGLKPSTRYIYQLKAGSSVANPLFVSTLDPELPFPPSSLIISGVTKKSVSLRWTDNSANEKGFQIERSLNYSTGYGVIASSGVNITQFTDTTVSPGTTYYYRVLAYNNNGKSPYTDVVTATTPELQPPLAPSGLITVQINYTSVRFKWNDNADNENEFLIERTSPTLQTEKVTYHVPANTEYFIDTGLEMNCTYQYRICSYNDDGHSGWSNSIEIVTPLLLPPVAPTKLKSTKYTENSISIKWSDNSTNEEAFIITRSLAADPSSEVAISIDANDTAYTDSSLMSSTTYQYTIKAINQAGSSGLSNNNVATTLSRAELKRVKEGLIAYYNFGFNLDYIIYDQSGYGDPLNLNILDRSATQWENNNTLEVLSNTAIVSITPAAKIVEAIKSTDEFTFEFWVKPSNYPSFYESRIVSLGNDDENIAFVLDQNMNYNDEEAINYCARVHTNTTVTSGYPEYRSELVESYITLQHLVFVHSHDGKEIMYINGKKTDEGFRPSNLDCWSDNYYLRLGNESDMLHSWKGCFYSVAIYKNALTEDQILTNFKAGANDSVKYEDMSYSLEVFPNPSSENVTLKITPELASDFVPETIIRIYDSFGKVWYEESVFNPNIQVNKVLDISFAPGLYIVQISSGRKKKTVKLVVN